MLLSVCLRQATELQSDSWKGNLSLHTCQDLAISPEPRATHSVEHGRYFGGVPAEASLAPPRDATDLTGLPTAASAHIAVGQRLVAAGGVPDAPNPLPL